MSNTGSTATPPNSTPGATSFIKTPDDSMQTQITSPQERALHASIPALSKCASLGGGAALESVLVLGGFGDYGTAAAAASHRESPPC